MVLLRRVIGDALRARRQAQHRTLREVSTAANVSLGYLSEIERGQKEASSELLGAICEALGAQLSELLREVSHTMAAEEQTVATVPEARTHTRPMPQMRPMPQVPAVPASRRDGEQVTDGEVSVMVRRDSPLRTTLLATRTRRGRETVPA